MSQVKNILFEKYRPTTFDEMVLSKDVKDYCERIKQSGDIPHLLFCSRAGTGKTSLAKCIASELGVSYRYINASDERGIDSIREKVRGYAETKSFDGKFKICILDECDGLTPDAQRLLRNTSEEYSKYIRFILTANYPNRIIEPLRSRTQIFELNPPLKGFAERIIHIIQKENIVVPNENGKKLMDIIRTVYPDMRRMINIVDQHTINGKLILPENIGHTEFAKQVLEKIQNNDVSSSIRKFIIDNEVEFGSDYHNLLRGLFDACFSIIENEKQKREAMVICADAMKWHNQVMDFEINAFCCILKLLEFLND